MNATPPSDPARIEELRSFKAAALSDVNEHMLSRVRHAGGEEREWEFLCECGKESCYEQVFLTVEAYIELRESGGAVLADGHVLSQVGRAQELRLEAEALRRQADHQIQRAERNLRDIDRS